MSMETSSPPESDYLLGLNTMKKKGIFWGYISMWAMQGLVIYGTKDENGNRTYNTTVVVALTEAFKLTLSSILYLKFDHDWEKGLPQGWTKTFFLYLIPAGLYCVYNNLTFVCLTRMDPATYYLMMQMRLLATALVWRILFAKEISAKQWKALVMITIGCVVKEMGARKSSTQEASFEDVDSGSLIITLGLVTIQILTSVFAGVYTEYLLKGNKTISTNLQNIFMYFNSIAANVLLLKMMPSSDSTAEQGLSMAAVMTVIANISTLFLVVNGACTGLMTAFFLSNLDSMRKCIAAALEIILIAFLSWLVFSTDLGPSTLAAAGLVSYGVYLYSAPATDNTDENNKSSSKQ